MKSLDDFYQEVQENEELKKEFISAFKEGKVEEFLKSHDCNASVSDIHEYLNGAKREAASEDDLANVAGGRCTTCTCNDDCARYSYQYPC